MIGDSFKDINAAKNAGIKPILLETNYNKKQKQSIEYIHIKNLGNLL